MRGARKAACLALAALLGRAPASGKENASATAAPILLVPMGSRALGMGGAFAAVASDASALYYNPAGLSRLAAHELSGSYSSGLADNSMSYFAYGGPMPFTGVTGGGYAGLGASLLYAPSGTVEILRTKPDGSFLSSEARNAGWDLVASLGYAERIGGVTIESPDGAVRVDNFLGLSGKIIHSNLAQDFADTSYAADVGYLLSIPNWGATLGISALNLGSYMKYIDQGDPLPSTMRFGAAYQWKKPRRQELTLAADGDYQLVERLWHAYGGLEYWWLPGFAFRAGYQFNQDNLFGLTLGLGFRALRVSVDYAWAAATGPGLGDTHRFTLGYRFGTRGENFRARQRSPSIEDLHDRRGDALERELEEEQAPREPREEKGGALPGWIY